MIYRIFLVIFFCFVTVFGSLAYWQSILQVSVSGAAAYSGPGDIITFVQWGGLRCYTAAKATGSTKVANIVRASDSMTSDINCLTSGGFDVSTATTFCNATTCKVVTIYDQVGTNDWTQSTDANRPALTFSCTGLGASEPCMMFTGGAMRLTNATNVTQAQPFTLYGVAKRVSGTSFDFVFTENSGNVLIGFSNAANTAALYAGTVLAVAATSDASWHTLVGTLNNASSTFVVDGTSNAGTTGASQFTTTTTSIGSDAGADGCRCTIVEAGFASGDQSGSGASLNTNAKTFWGF